MSLHRVSSMTSYEHVRNSSPARSEHRKMSFNPAGSKLMPVHTREAPVGASGVARSRRILQIVIAVTYCLFSAGVVFGYAALKPVLVQEGVYGGYCSLNDEEEEALDFLRMTQQEGAGIKDHRRTCYEQELRLNFMFTTAAVVTNVCALPVGTILDRYGPRVSGIIGSILLAIGAVFLAFANRLSFDGYIPGYVFLALGGPFVFISSFQLSNAFPQHAGLILALLTGAFDSSSAVFLLYRLIYSASGDTFSPRSFFSFYLVVPLFILIVQIFFMPANSYKTIGEIASDQREAECDNEEAVDQNEEVYSSDDENILIPDPKAHVPTTSIDERTTLLSPKFQEPLSKQSGPRSDSIQGALHGQTATSQILTPWFILIAIFTTLQMTRINYFVATIHTQYAYLLGSDTLATQLNHAFDIALPLGGIISIPFIGLLLDNTSTPICLTFLVSLATIIGILGLIPHSLAAGYANIALFTLYRPLYYTAISDYAAKVFGFATFGKVYGAVICLAGLMNFSQAGLDALTYTAFKGDPAPVNAALLIAVLAVGIVLVVYVTVQSRRMAQRQKDGNLAGEQ